MTKQVKEQARNKKSAPAEHPSIPPKFQHPVAIALIYICLLIFFHSITFDGKTYESADSIASHSWDTFLEDSRTEEIIPLWNPYIFCGMPGYASLTYSIPRNYDILSLVLINVRSVIAYIFIVHYGTQELELRATATGNNLLFISEAYYPKGWKAYIDGKETEILRLNYLFRGVVIPPGKHTLFMKFDPETYHLGKSMSLITNTVISVLIIGFITIPRIRKKHTII